MVKIITNNDALMGELNYFSR